MCLCDRESKNGMCFGLPSLPLTLQLAPTLVTHCFLFVCTCVCLQAWACVWVLKKIKMCCQKHRCFSSLYSTCMLTLMGRAMTPFFHWLFSPLHTHNTHRRTHKQTTHTHGRRLTRMLSMVLNRCGRKPLASLLQAFSPFQLYVSRFNFFIVSSIKEDKCLSLWFSFFCQTEALSRSGSVFPACSSCPSCQSETNFSFFQRHWVDISFSLFARVSVCQCVSACVYVIEWHWQVKGSNRIGCVMSPPPLTSTLVPAGGCVLWPATSRWWPAAGDPSRDTGTPEPPRPAWSILPPLRAPRLCSPERTSGNSESGPAPTAPARKREWGRTRGSSASDNSPPPGKGPCRRPRRRRGGRGWSRDSPATAARGVGSESLGCRLLRQVGPRRAECRGRRSGSPSSKPKCGSTGRCGWQRSPWAPPHQHRTAARTRRCLTRLCRRPTARPCSPSCSCPPAKRTVTAPLWFLAGRGHHVTSQIPAVPFPPGAIRAGGRASAAPPRPGPVETPPRGARQRQKPNHVWSWSSSAASSRPVSAVI